MKIEEVREQESEFCFLVSDFWSCVCLVKSHGFNTAVINPTGPVIIMSPAGAEKIPSPFIFALFGPVNDIISGWFKMFWK